MKQENKINVLLGLQWGDEGKGKIIDYLTKNYDIIARFQGGPNAGHTIEFEGKKYILHLIPSGIFHPDKINLMGNGMVICPIAFQKEVEELAQDIPLEELKKRIVISNRANLIMPTHRLLDCINEKSKGDKKIGTTGKGIGPAYSDHTSRIGLVVGDIDNNDFAIKSSALNKKHLEILKDHDVDMDALTKENYQFLTAAKFMQEFEFVNGPYWIDKQLNTGKKILAEGAQGTFLDIDHGNYPFVTSSNTTIGGVCTGLGVSAHRIGKVYGLFKAYCTRVGAGPFPTELGGEESDEWCATKKVEDENTQYPDPDINSSDPFIQGIALRRKGSEFGATTGRLRRTGWLDLPALKYACMINGVTDLIISKADVLSGLKTVRIYETHIEGDEYANEQAVMGNQKPNHPVFRIFGGWENNLRKKKRYIDLPLNLTKYLEYIQRETERPIVLISTGPDRSEMIFH